MKINGYDFEGPHYRPEDLRDAQGVYVIIDARSDSYYAVDVGESGVSVRRRVQTNERQSCWDHQRLGRLGVVVCYTPGWTDHRRLTLEGHTRDYLDPPCGKN